MTSFLQMMMTFITQGGEGRGEKIRRGKLRKAKAEALKRGLVARSCARSGKKDVVGESLCVCAHCSNAKTRGPRAEQRFRWARRPAHTRRGYRCYI